MIKQITAAVLLAATSFAASAASVPKFYVGGDVGSTKITVEDGIPSATSVGIFAGYNFNDFVAIEVGYRRLANWSDDFASAEVKQTAVSVLGYLPMVDHIAAYGRLGYNRNSVSFAVDNGGDFNLGHKNDYLLGLGVSYEFTKQITGRVELQRPTAHAHNVSAGVSFNF